MDEERNLNNSEDESLKEGQSASETQEEVKEEEEREEKSSEDLLKDTPLKTLEDLKNAYKNLQQEFTKTRQQMASYADIKRQIEEYEKEKKLLAERRKLLSAKTYQEKYPDDMATGLDELLNAREAELRREFYDLLGVMTAQTMLKVFKATRPEDFKKYKDQIIKTLKETPQIGGDIDILDKIVDQIKQKEMANMTKAEKEKLRKNVEKEVLKKYGMAEKDTHTPEKKKLTPEEAYKKYIFGG